MTVFFIGTVVLFLIVFAGFPLGFSLLVVGTSGFAILRGVTPAFGMVSQQVLEVVLNPNFVVLPMFILMGAFIYRAALADDLFDAANSWLGHFRGGLAMASMAACGGFAAVSGSSLATVTTMTKVAMPSMRRHAYADSLATGTIAAGGSIGILIPPSAALIVYGILTEQDIAALFAAGILPGPADRCPVYRRDHGDDSDPQGPGSARATVPAGRNAGSRPGKSGALCSCSD